MEVLNLFEKEDLESLTWEAIDTKGNLLIITEEGAEYTAGLHRYLEGYTEAVILTYSFSAEPIVKLFHKLGYNRLTAIVGLPYASQDTIKLSAGKLLHYFGRADTQAEEIKKLSREKDLLDKIISGKYRVLYTTNSHAKIAYLKGNGKERIITGSANFTTKALSGSQWEIMFVLDEKDERFDAIVEMLHQVEKSAIPYYSRKLLSITKDKLKEGKPIVFTEEDQLQALSESIEEVQIALSPIELAKAFEHIKEKSEASSSKENVQTIYQRTRVILNIISRPSGNGRQLIAPSMLHKEKVKLQDALKGISGKPSEKKEFEDTRPVLEYRSGKLFVVDAPLGKRLNRIELARELEEFDRFISSYREGTGDPETSRIVFEAVLYTFFSPFMHIIRQRLKLEGEDRIPDIPVFLFIAGEPGSGKTFLLKQLEVMLGGKCYYQYATGATFPAGHINDKAIALLLYSNNPFPILVDEIKRQYFSSQDQSKKYSGVHFIKEFANHVAGTHPCLICAGNLKEFTAPPEVMRRVYYLPLSVPFIKKEKTSKYHLSDVLFQEFVARTEEKLSSDTLLEEVVKYASKDFLKPGREVFLEMLEDAGMKTPFWFVHTQYKDIYYTEKAKRAWEAIVKANPHVFSKTKVYSDGKEYYDITQIMQEQSRSDRDKLLQYLPAGVLAESSGVYLLNAERFRSFLDNNEKLFGSGSFSWLKQSGKRVIESVQQKVKESYLKVAKKSVHALR